MSSFGEGFECLFCLCVVICFSDAMEARARKHLAEALSNVALPWESAPVTMTLLLVLRRFGFRFPAELIREIVLFTGVSSDSICKGLFLSSGEAQWYELRDFGVVTRFFNSSGLFLEFEYSFHERGRHSFVERSSIVQMRLGGRKQAGHDLVLFEDSDAEVNQVFRRVVTGEALDVIKMFMFGKNARVSRLKMTDIAVVLSGMSLHPSTEERDWPIGRAKTIWPNLLPGESLSSDADPVDEFLDCRREDEEIY